MLCTANHASAHPVAQTKTRVWDFESAALLNTWPAALASQQTHPENPPPQCRTRVSFPSRSRVWSPELGSFLEADEFGFLTRTGTLWSWPGQNPLRYRDPSGRFPWLLPFLEGAGVGLAFGSVFFADSDE